MILCNIYNEYKNYIIIKFKNLYYLFIIIIINL